MSNLGNKEIMARNIKKFMDRKNVNQTQICSALNLKQSTFSDWVNAKTYPRIDKIEMLANYFGVEKSDLVEEEIINYSAVFDKKDFIFNSSYLKEHPDYLEDITVVNRAIMKMTPEKKEKMMKLLRLSFEEEFNED